MSEKKKIVLVLPRGEAIRNFVYSGTAAHLRKSAHLTIISVVANKEIESLLIESTDAFYELEEPPGSYFLYLAWIWIDIVHGRWLWSGAAKMRWKIRDSEMNSFSKRIKHRIKKVLAYPFANRYGLEVLTGVETILSRITYNNNNEYISLFEELKPDLVFNGSHIHSLISRPVIHAARRLGIKTATFLFSWDNLTSQGRILPYHDFYLVWNDQIKKDLLQIYKKIRESQVYVTGTPQFDFHFNKGIFSSRAQYAELIGVDPARPIILYTTGMLNLMPDEDIIVERLGDICQQIESKPQLVVRVYPKDLSGRFDVLKGRRKDIVFPEIIWEHNFLTPDVKDLGFYSNMLFHCELGVNVASTVSLELCIFDKPVINIGYNPFGVDISPKNFAAYYQWEHYKPITDSGAVDIAYREEEMEGLIRSALEYPELKSNARKKLVENFFGPYLDGKSGERIAKVLLEIASKPS